MGRQGISFTLTIVVAGVILLMTALSIITLGGSSISNFFKTIQGEQEEAVTDADVREACQELAQKVTNNYCGHYLDSSVNNPCKNVQEKRDTTHTRTASQRGCNWVAKSNYNPKVTVRGNTYNCIDEGHMTDTCPVQ